MAIATPIGLGLSCDLLGVVPPPSTFTTVTTLRDVTATPPQSVHFFSDLGMITSRRMEKCASKISSQIGLPC